VDSQGPNRRRVLDRSRVTMAAPRKGTFGMAFFRGPRAVCTAHGRTRLSLRLYEHEPVALLGVAVALGACAMWVAGRVEDRVFSTWTGMGTFGIASVASVSEETLKLLVVAAVALLVAAGVR